MDKQIAAWPVNWGYYYRHELVVTRISGNSVCSVVHLMIYWDHVSFDMRDVY